MAVTLRRCDGIEITVGQNDRRCFEPSAGKTQHFKDCETCPEMVIVPAGGFTLGSPSDEPERDEFGEDQVSVSIDKPIAVGRFAVTRSEFAAFVTATNHKTDGGCRTYTDSELTGRAGSDWRSPGFAQTDRHPVVCVSWDDAKAYAAWLTSTTGKHYRLLSEAEREYAARAGTTTPFWWGSAIMPTQANYDGAAEPYKGGGSKGEDRQRTVPVDSFEPNPWGLYQVHGNVFEWTADCRHDKNASNPGDGTARSSSVCVTRVLRGGSWVSIPGDLRSARRVGNIPNSRFNTFGFRVARTLSPP
jgi:formylglycine-generating enzyme required for sulfatase activity